MATLTTVELVDDLDGREADQTISFTIEGVDYEIDLHKKNADALRKAFKPYVEAGRRMGGRKNIKVTQLPDARPPLTKQERASVRKFARANDLGNVSDRGRIANSIVAAWVEAGRPI